MRDQGVSYIAAYGSETQKKAWLPGCVSGDIITAIAMTEPGTVSDMKAITMAAVKDGNDCVINGQKTFVSNGNLVIVVCRTDRAVDSAHMGMSLIVVEKDAPGFSRGTPKKCMILAQNQISYEFRYPIFPREFGLI